MIYGTSRTPSPTSFCRRFALHLSSGASFERIPRNEKQFCDPQTIYLKSKSRRGSRRRIAVKSKGKPSIFIPQSVCFIPVIQENPNQYLKATCSSFSPEKTHIETVSPKTMTAKTAILNTLLNPNYTRILCRSISESDLFLFFTRENTHRNRKPQNYNCENCHLIFLLIIRSAFAELSYVCILSQKNLRKK